MPSNLTISDVKVFFPKRRSVGKVTYEGKVELGKVTIFVGTNGSGKTSFVTSLYPIATSLNKKAMWIGEIASLTFTTLKWPLPLGAVSKVNDSNVKWFRWSQDLEHFLSFGDINESELLEVYEDTANKVLCESKDAPQTQCCGELTGLYVVPGSSDNRVYGKACLNSGTARCIYSVISNKFCMNAGDFAETTNGYIALFYSPHLPLIRNGIMGAIKAFLEDVRNDGNVYKIKEGYWKEAMGFRSNDDVSIKSDDSELSFKVLIDRNGEEYPIWSLGDGQRAALSMYILVETIKRMNEEPGLSTTKKILVLDTPEAFMHPELAEQLASSIVHDLFFEDNNDNNGNGNNNDNNVHLIVTSQSLEFIQYILSKYCTLKSDICTDSRDSEKRIRNEIKAYLFERISAPTHENKVQISEIVNPHIHVAYGTDLRLLRG